MDTITHGIAGALLGKALFRGEDMIAPQPLTKNRVVTWAFMVGAVFPDSDILRDWFSHNPLLLLTWHRSITHSIICLPAFALLLAAITRAVARALKWSAPGFGFLAGIYALGILSHIVLDLATTFGTMIWSPLNWSRPAWDLLFIVDFSFAAILLVPQFVAWVYRKAEGLRNRAGITWSLFALASLGVAAIAKNVGAPISAGTAMSVIAILAAIFLLPVIRGRGLRVSHAAWNRGGLAAAVLYLIAAFLAHRAALERVRQFASLYQLNAESLGALPLPPSIWHWDGLVQTPHGVYDVRFDLGELWASRNSAAKNSDPLAALEHRYYPDAFPNPYIAKAKSLKEVQTVLWFARFPVIRFHKEGEEAIVEITDKRFAQMRSGRPDAFTYRVRMDGEGNVVSQGWVRD